MQAISGAVFSGDQANALGIVICFLDFFRMVVQGLDGAHI